MPKGIGYPDNKGTARKNKPKKTGLDRAADMSGRTFSNKGKAKGKK